MSNDSLRLRRCPGLRLYKLLHRRNIIHRTRCVDIIINRMDYPRAYWLCYILLDLLLRIIGDSLRYDMRKQNEDTRGNNKTSVKITKRVST